MRAEGELEFPEENIGLTVPRPGVFGSLRSQEGPPVSIQGISLNNLSMDEAVHRIVEASESFASYRVCFVNAHCVNVARKDSAYHTALRGADLVLADGSGMKLAARLVGRPIRDNVNGTDLFPRLLERLAGKRVYLLGARAEVVHKVAGWIEQQYPEVEVCGTQHGYFDGRDEERVVRAVAASRAHVLFVAFGVPAQDKWIAEHREQLGVPVAMGVGGLFDFYSGRIPRAPRWLRKLGLEWVFRLLQEPARMWRRYLIGNVSFLLHIMFVNRSWPWSWTRGE